MFMSYVRNAQNMQVNTLYWLTTQYPVISINPEKWMNYSKSY